MFFCQGEKYNKYDENRHVSHKHLVANSAIQSYIYAFMLFTIDMVANSLFNVVSSNSTTSATSKKSLLLCNNNCCATVTLQMQLTSSNRRRQTMQ